MNLKFFCIVLILAAPLWCAAQDDFLIEEEEKKSALDNFVLDTNLALQFGTYTFLGANPQLGYQISSRIVAGAGYSYNLLTYKFPLSDRVYNSLRGPTVFGRLIITDSFFLRTDYQSLTSIEENGTSIPSEFSLERWYVGVGQRYYLSQKLYANASLNIDVLAPVIRPVFRTGIEYSFGGWN